MQSLVGSVSYKSDYDAVEAAVKAGFTITGNIAKQKIYPIILIK